MCNEKRFSYPIEKEISYKINRKMEGKMARGTARSQLELQDISPKGYAHSASDAIPKTRHNELLKH
jgi:hypothetical protein